MNCSRNFALLTAVAGLVMFVSVQRSSEAQVVIYGGYGAYYGDVYSAPVYPAAVYPAPAFIPPAAVYPGPVPLAYGAYYAPYPAVAPIGHGVIAPRNGLEINYEFRNGLWFVDIDD